METEALADKRAEDTTAEAPMNSQHALFTSKICSSSQRSQL